MEKIIPRTAILICNEELAIASKGLFGNTENWLSIVSYYCVCACKSLILMRWCLVDPLPKRGRIIDHFIVKETF